MSKNFVTIWQNSIHKLKESSIFISSLNNHPYSPVGCVHMLGSAQLLKA